MYNFLQAKVANIKIAVVVEKKESYYFFLKRRFKKNGLLTVLGQIIFILFIAMPQAFFFKSKINSILDANGLVLNEIPIDKIINVESINSSSFHDILIENTYSYIILCGSRIVSRKTLEISRNKFINIHAGITPFYRGVHGLYWALYNGESNKGGVTLHFVDCGIDTGGIISQEIVNVSKSDNFTTYPYLQFCSGLKLLLDFLNYPKQEQNYSFKKELVISKLYYHPTIFQYVTKYFKHNVK